MSTNLGELERDALGEAFNMALGEAAASFAELVQEEITLSVPSVDLLARQELAERLAALQLPGLAERLTAISQNFHSQDRLLNTEALLLFGEQGSLEIVRRMLGQHDMPLEHITELEQDAPAQIASKTCSSFSNAVCIMTLILGNFCFTTFTASIPFMPGISISINITSGWLFSISEMRLLQFEKVPPI